MLSCNEQNKLKIAVLGFGNLGQSVAREMVMQGHHVLACPRSDCSSSRVAEDIGVRYFDNVDDLCDEHPEVVLLCTSILSTEAVLRSVPMDRLGRATLFVDALSVKEFPRTLFLKHLPKDFDILCTHPMFGPGCIDSGWAGLPFVYDKVRVGPGPTRANRVETFINIFKNRACKMVEMSCAEHDKYAAGCVFITHMMGRVLGQMGLSNTPINTNGYQSLLNLVDDATKNDGFEMFLYNKNAVHQLDRLDWAFDVVMKQLSARIREL